MTITVFDSLFQIRGDDVVFQFETSNGYYSLKLSRPALDHYIQRYTAIGELSSALPKSHQYFQAFYLSARELSSTHHPEREYYVNALTELRSKGLLAIMGVE